MLCHIRLISSLLRKFINVFVYPSFAAAVVLRNCVQCITHLSISRRVRSSAEYSRLMIRLMIALRESIDFLILSEYCDMILGGYCRIPLGWLYHIMTSPATQLTTLQDCPFGRNFARQFCNFTRQICKFAGNSPKRGTIYDKPIKKSRRRERKNL